jgi:DNA polymerase elongation subunit (family B)
MAAPDTPTKTCTLSDICVLCGFSFVQYEKKDNGEVILHKHFDRKLRFTTEREGNVYKITGIHFSSNSAVCLKCYRSVESVLKSEQKNENIKANICSMARKINETYLLQLPSPRRKVITKRMLRSPVVTQSAKKDKTFPIEAVKYMPVHIAPFKEITNTSDINKPKVVRRSLEFQESHVNPQANEGEIEVSKYQIMCLLFVQFA